jgi:hypothetical protein
MSDIVLRGTARAHNTLHNVAGAVKRIPERLREQDGQDTVEYIGVLVLVAALIAAVYLFIPTVSGDLQKGATGMVNSIFSHGGGGGGTGTTPGG